MESVHISRNPLLLLFGVPALLIGAGGTLLTSALLGQLLPAVLANHPGYPGGLLLFQLLGLVAFAALFLTGIRLWQSWRSRRSRDVVPGLALYFVGAPLVIIGLQLFTLGHAGYALAAMLAGALIIWLEWHTDAI